MTEIRRIITIMTRTQQHTQSDAIGEPADKLWYAPDLRVETDDAAQHARTTADWITRGASEGAPPDEMALFTALHASAFRAVQAGREGEADLAAAWQHKWEVIREYLVQRNLGLVHLMIKRYRAKDPDEDDLLTHG